MCVGGVGAELRARGPAWPWVAGRGAPRPGAAAPCLPWESTRVRPRTPLAVPVVPPPRRLAGAVGLPPPQPVGKGLASAPPTPGDPLPAGSALRPPASVSPPGGVGDGSCVVARGGRTESSLRQQGAPGSPELPPRAAAPGPTGGSGPPRVILAPHGWICPPHASRLCPCRVSPRRGRARAAGAAHAVPSCQETS